MSRATKARIYIYIRACRFGLLHLLHVTGHILLPSSFIPSFPAASLKIPVLQVCLRHCNKVNSRKEAE